MRFGGRDAPSTTMAVLCRGGCCRRPIGCRSKRAVLSSLPFERTLRGPTKTPARSSLAWPPRIASLTYTEPYCCHFAHGALRLAIIPYPASADRYDDAVIVRSLPRSAAILRQSRCNFALEGSGRLNKSEGRTSHRHSARKPLDIDTKVYDRKRTTAVSLVLLTSWWPWSGPVEMGHAALVRLRKQAEQYPTFSGGRTQKWRA